MKTAGCPLCKRPASPAERPFCSRGCRDRDLLRWLDDGYRMPARSGVEEEDPGGVDKPYAPD